MREIRNISSRPASRKPICLWSKPRNLVISVADLISSTLITDNRRTKPSSTQSKSRKEERRRMDTPYSNAVLLVPHRRNGCSCRHPAAELAVAVARTLPTSKSRPPRGLLSVHRTQRLLGRRYPEQRGIELHEGGIHGSMLLMAAIAVRRSRHQLRQAARAPEREKAPASRQPGVLDVDLDGQNLRRLRLALAVDRSSRLRAPELEHQLRSVRPPAAAPEAGIARPIDEEVVEPRMLGRMPRRAGRRAVAHIQAAGQGDPLAVPVRKPELPVRGVDRSVGGFVVSGGCAIPDRRSRTVPGGLGDGLAGRVPQRPDREGEQRNCRHQQRKPERRPEPTQHRGAPRKKTGNRDTV